MDGAHANLRCRLAAAALLSAVTAHAREATAQRSPEDTAFVRWAAAHAVPVRSVEPEGSLADLRPLASIIGSARVVAIGEPTHGAHEPLAFRNRLLRYLVEEMGFTAIAIESGLTESRRLADFVAGGPGAPPIADAALVTGESMTWGFGNFAENVELARWIRAYNANPASPRKVRLYGFDLSLGGPTASTPLSTTLEATLSYLARVDAQAAGRARASLAPYLDRLPGDGSRPFTSAERSALAAAIEGIVSQLERDRAAYVAASSEHDFAWARRNAEVARQGNVLIAVQTPPQPGPGIPPGAWREITARDSAMAENVRWVLEREGPTGRVFVFAHDIHVKNATTEGGMWSTLARPPRVMGQFLRDALGDELLIVGVSDGTAPAADPTSVDAALARVGVPRFIVDLRAARGDAAAAAWLGRRRSLRTNSQTVITLSPSSAFDVLFYAGALTPARSAPK